MPEDRTIKSGSNICKYGIKYKTIKDGEEEALEMWKKFFKPLLIKYKRSKDVNKELYEDVYDIVKDTVIGRGKFESFRI